MSSFADMAIGRRAVDEPAMRAPQLQSAVLALFWEGSICRSRRHKLQLAASSSS